MEGRLPVQDSRHNSNCSLVQAVESSHGDFLHGEQLLENHAQCQNLWTQREDIQELQMWRLKWYSPTGDLHHLSFMPAAHSSVPQWKKDKTGELTGLAVFLTPSNIWWRNMHPDLLHCLPKARATISRVPSQVGKGLRAVPLEGYSISTTWWEIDEQGLGVSESLLDKLWILYLPYPLEDVRSEWRHSRRATGKFHKHGQQLEKGIGCLQHWE